MIMLQALLMAGVSAAHIRSYPLDERSLYTVRLSKDEPTTCVFPGALTALEGARISARIEDRPDVLLSHPAGAEFFSLRALAEEATAALNVVYRGKVYSFRFVTGGEPDRAVILIDQPLAGKLSRGPVAESWRTLLAQAKQLSREVQQYPEMQSSLPRLRPESPTYYRTFTAFVEEIVRFDTEDALVFTIRLENLADTPLRYDAEALAVRARHEIFPAILTDATGEVPARSVAQVHLVVAGDMEGRRANLSVRETFTVMVPPL